MGWLCLHPACPVGDIYAARTHMALSMQITSFGALLCSRVMSGPEICPRDGLDNKGLGKPKAICVLQPGRLTHCL